MKAEDLPQRPGFLTEVLVVKLTGVLFRIGGPKEGDASMVKKVHQVTSK